MYSVVLTTSEDVYEACTTEIHLRMCRGIQTGVLLMPKLACPIWKEFPGLLYHTFNTSAPDLNHTAFKGLSSKVHWCGNRTVIIPGSIQSVWASTFTWHSVGPQLNGTHWDRHCHAAEWCCHLIFCDVCSWTCVRLLKHLTVTAGIDCVITWFVVTEVQYLLDRMVSEPQSLF
jgi:hypothetical protein